MRTSQSEMRLNLRPNSQGAPNNASVLEEFWMTHEYNDVGLISHEHLK